MGKWKVKRLSGPFPLRMIDSNVVIFMRIHEHEERIWSCSQSVCTQEIFREAMGGFIVTYHIGQCFEKCCTSHNFPFRWDMFNGDLT
jgi:hypothetical protein